MKPGPQPIPANPAGTWEMYRAMVGVGIACGLLIVGVYEATRPVIERNKAEALQRAIFQVLPDARSSSTFRLNGQQRFDLIEEQAGGESRVHAGYDENRRLVGLVVEAEGMGYQDVIRLLYGYSFEHDAIVGLHVLESRETPGLGDRIETDADFLENFRRLDVTLTHDLSGLVHPIESVKHGEKEQAWQVDEITGATISSVAVGDILSRSTRVWIPLLRRNLDDFRNRGPEDP